MRIKKLHIRNFKSLVDFELEDLKPFCAFVGPNASGKSNIFEAIEFANYVARFSVEAPDFFGGKRSILSFSPLPLKSGAANAVIIFKCEFKDGISVDFTGTFTNNGDGFSNFIAVGPALDSVTYLSSNFLHISDIKKLSEREQYLQTWKRNLKKYDNDYEQYYDNFSRIFVGKQSINKIPVSSSRLSPDASNVAQIIGNIFEDDLRRHDFIEWLQILIPEFKDIEVKKSNIDGSYDFFIYEKGSSRPFPRNLISDGTNNILSLMAAVYQSDQPQFLCIEEPENGLHPQAIELLVDFFREKCQEEGHHIWLNTHSQTLVRCLEIDEIILVNKIDGATHAKQLTKKDNINIKTDEAWLSNALGGGVLWSK